VTSSTVEKATDHGLQPWQFFVLAALGCATAIAYLSRGQGLVVVILGTVLMATAGIIGLAALRALRPLVSPEGDRTVMVGQRTRAALEREKLLTLRTIKELEFDRAMGKLSDADWQEMSTKLRARAAGLMKQLDAATGYRDQIEKDLAKRMGDSAARLKPRVPPGGVEREALAEREAAVGMEREALAEREAERVCESCSTTNDHDARFCKSCGQKL
jgi:hypothetical protein